MKTIQLLLFLFLSHCAALNMLKRYEEDWEEMFDMEDMDNDGMIVFEEFQAAFEEYRILGADESTPEENLQLFNRSDKNQDGALDREEYGEMMADLGF